MSKKLAFDCTFEIFDAFDQLTEQDKSIVKAAIESAARAYAPYSHFNVGSAVVSRKGDIITGNNQENAAYPSGLCAERVALFSAFSKCPDVQITAIAIVANRNGKSKPAFPCGSCRQTILKYEIKQKHPIRVVMAYHKGAYLVTNSIKDLLPLGFTRNDL